MTGHGGFRAYLHRFKIASDDVCVYCGECDTAEHTLFTCDRWTRLRSETQMGLGEEWIPDNMVEKMLQSGEVERYIVRVIRTKDGRQEDPLFEVMLWGCSKKKRSFDHAGRGFSG